MFKNFLLIVLISLLVHAASCSKDTSGLTIKNGILSVGVEIGYPPMEYMAQDGITPIGFDISLAKAIARKLELKVQFIDTAWNGILAGVNSHKYDCIISSVTILPERLENYNFSRPYIQTSLAIIILKDSVHNVSAPQHLSNLRVAYQEATTSGYFMRQLEKEGITFSAYEYDKVTYCFDELRLGRTDAVITDLLVAHEYLARSDTYKIVWQGSREFFGICLKKGNDALTEKINTALDELFEDGTMLRLSEENFNGMDHVSAVWK